MGDRSVWRNLRFEHNADAFSFINTGVESQLINCVVTGLSGNTTRYGVRLVNNYSMVIRCEIFGAWDDDEARFDADNCKIALSHVPSIAFVSGTGNKTVGNSP